MADFAVLAKSSVAGSNGKRDCHLAVHFRADTSVCTNVCDSVIDTSQKETTQMPVSWRMGE